MLVGAGNVTSFYVADNRRANHHSSGAPEAVGAPPDGPANYQMPEIQILSDKLLAPLWTGEQAPEPLVASVLGRFQALLDQPKLQ